jgi:isopenicillin N synthase-like dioxygenase
MEARAVSDATSLVCRVECRMSEGAGLVDLSLWDRDAAALVEQVRQAAVGTGFLNVYNHGIPDDVVEAAFAASRSFFALPDEVKARTPFVGWAGGWEKEKQGAWRACTAW